MSSIVNAQWIPTTIVAGNTATLTWSSSGTTGITFSGAAVQTPSPAGTNNATLQGRLALPTGSQTFTFNTAGTYVAAWQAYENTVVLSQVTGFANIVVTAPPAVTPAVAITVSNTAPVYTQPITVTATVNPVNPGDTVNVLDGTAVIATGDVSSGTATFFFNNLSIGTHSLQVFYAGNLQANYNNSTTTATTVTVTSSPDAVVLLNNTNNFIADGNVQLSLTGLSLVSNAIITGGVLGGYSNVQMNANLKNYVGNIASNVQFNSIGNVQVNNIVASGFYFPNNQPFTSSVYSNANVTAYLPTYSGTVTSTNVYVSTGNITSTSGGNVAGNIIGRFGQFASMKMLTSNIAGATGSVSLDCGQYNAFRLNLTGNVSLSIVNPPPATIMSTIYVWVSPSVTASQYVSWPASFVFPGGITPTQSNIAGRTDWFSATTINGGTTWFATIIAQNFIG